MKYFDLKVFGVVYVVFINDLMVFMDCLCIENELFVVVIVVCMILVMVVKVGVKVIIGCDGLLMGGWIGGGCVCFVVIKVVKVVIEDGEIWLIFI